MDPKILAWVREALEVVPPNPDRQTWVELISMPLHDVFKGSDLGFEVWHAWCRRAAGLHTPNGNPAYGGEAECRKVWRSFSTRKRNPKGIATFWAYARKCGWQPSSFAETPPPAADTAPAAAGAPVGPLAPGMGPLGPLAAPEDELQPWRTPEPIWKAPDRAQLDMDRAFTPELGWLRDFLVRVAELQQVDPAFPALLALGIVAGAAGKHWELRLAGTGWREPIALWTICAMESGTGKSPVFRPLVKPLREWELKISEQEDRGIADWEAERDLAMAQLARASRPTKKQLEDAEDNPIRREELQDALITARRRIADLDRERPQSRGLMASSLTTAALVAFLASHQQRCLIVDPEGGVFNHAFAGRSNVERDIDPWLKGYSSETIKQERVGGDRHRGNTVRFVADPVLSMALSTQIDALDLFRDQYAESRGFLARFITATFDYDLPTLAIVEGEMPAELQARWGARIHALLDRVIPEKPAEILLCEQGADLFKDWMQRWLDVGRADPVADKADVCGYGSAIGAKIRSNVLRIIALLHILEDPDAATARRPSVAVVRAVLDVWAPFIVASTRRTMMLIRDDPDLRSAMAVLTQIARHGYREFSRSELQRKMKGSHGISRTDDLNRPLALLVDAGWVQPLGKPSYRGTTTVPAAARYVVHPEFTRHYEAASD